MVSNIHADLEDLLKDTPWEGDTMQDVLGHDINGRPLRANHHPSDESFGEMVASLARNKRAWA